ncbi:DUF2835 family protein [Marinospirillum sp.]|uniref:DUF2835 family protein n=1 Tax=Marinospirillum sp. TaxID=2183934 RepID=UPI003A85CA6D
MPSVTVRLNVSAQEVMNFYQSSALNVKTTSVDGRSVVFPRRLLRTMVTHQGIQGLFRIHFNEQGQFVQIERLAP